MGKNETVIDECNCVKVTLVLRDSQKKDPSGYWLTVEGEKTSVMSKKVMLRASSMESVFRIINENEVQSILLEKVK
jgi:hypothetical protein